MSRRLRRARKRIETTEGADVSKKLEGKRIAFLATDMVEQVELTEPWKAVRDEGAKVELVSLEEGKIQGFNHYDKGDMFGVDRVVEEASASDYDALVIPGGVGNPDTMRTDENAVAFVRDFFEQGKPVGVICHGPWMLVEAGVARGRKVTSWPSLRPTSATPGASGSTRRSWSTRVSSRAGNRTTSLRSTRRSSKSSARAGTRSRRRRPRTRSTRTRLRSRNETNEGGSRRPHSAGATGVSSYGVCLTLLETHLPNAFDLFAFVPY